MLVVCVLVGLFRLVSVPELHCRSLGVLGAERGGKAAGVVRVEGQLAGKLGDCSYMYGSVCLGRDSRDLMPYY